MKIPTIKNTLRCWLLWALLFMPLPALVTSIATQGNYALVYQGEDKEGAIFCRQDSEQCTHDRAFSSYVIGKSYMVETNEVALQQSTFLCWLVGIGCIIWFIVLFVALVGGLIYIFSEEEDDGDSF